MFFTFKTKAFRELEARCARLERELQGSKKLVERKTNDFWAKVEQLATLHEKYESFKARVHKHEPWLLQKIDDKGRFTGEKY